MATSRLLCLPPELRSTIVSWLFRNSDLANVCLVSKALRETAMPMLYDCVVLNVDKWHGRHLDQFLVHGHPGHRLIRTLNIDSLRLETEKTALKAAKDALQVIPRDQLHSFRCFLETGIDNDLIILLAAQQRNLKITGLGPLLDNALNIPQALLPWPSPVKSVIIPWKIGGERDVIFYRQLIERSHKTLRSLTIRVEKTSDTINGINLDVLSPADDIATGLFRQHEPMGGQRPLVLTDFNLQNQDLSNASQTWLSIIDFSKLQTLQMWNCDNMDQLFENLRGQDLQLEGLVVSSEATHQAPKHAQDFIRSLHNLQYINLCYSPPAQEDITFDVRCLKNHAHTIKDLYIGIGENGRTSGGLYELAKSDLAWLGSNCLHLRQLAIAFPVLVIKKALSGQWGNFGDALETIATLPRLKVLRILTWPVPTFTSGELRHHGSMLLRRYCQYLDIVADSIARRFCGLRDDHCERLSAITFGSAQRWDYISHTHQLASIYSKQPATYKIRRHQSEFGSLLETERIEPHLMQYEENIAYVVDDDTDQGLSLEAYPSVV